MPNGRSPPNPSALGIPHTMPMPITEFTADAPNEQVDTLRGPRTIARYELPRIVADTRHALKTAFLVKEGFEVLLCQAAFLH